MKIIKASGFLSVMLYVAGAIASILGRGEIAQDFMSGGFACSIVMVAMMVIDVQKDLLEFMRCVVELEEVILSNEFKLNKLESMINANQTK